MAPEDAETVFPRLIQQIPEVALETLPLPFSFWDGKMFSVAPPARETF